MLDHDPNIDFSELEYEFSLKPHPDQALSDYVISFYGFIECWDDELLVDVKIGEISGYRIDMVSAEANGIDKPVTGWFISMKSILMPNVGVWA